jgi:hypothetical protein
MANPCSCNNCGNPNTSCFDPCPCQEVTLPMPCDPCVIGTGTVVATPFVNCNVIRCDAGCEETYPWECISHVGGCTIIPQYIQKDCFQGKTKITFSPIFFGGGASGWELYIDGVLNSTNLISQKEVTINTTSIVTKTFKIKDVAKGCEIEFNVTFNGCAGISCYQLTVPKVNDNTGQDYSTLLAVQSAHPGVFYDISSPTEMIFSLYGQTVAPEPFTQHDFYTSSLMLTYLWVTIPCPG